MKTRIVFEAQFDRTGISAHRCEVHIHSSQTAMRSVMRRVHKTKDNKNTEAFHWGANKPGKDRVTSEIHLPKTAEGCVKRNLIVHESVHAAFHRCYLLGFQFNDPSFEELLACGTEDLSTNIALKLEQMKIKVL